MCLFDNFIKMPFRNSEDKTIKYFKGDIGEAEQLWPRRQENFFFAHGQLIKR